jgi:hypothetical protein
MADRLANPADGWISPDDGCVSPGPPDGQGRSFNRQEGSCRGRPDESLERKATWDVNKILSLVNHKYYPNEPDRLERADRGCPDGIPPKVFMPDTDLCIDTVFRQETMTISAYQIDNILKAYSRQSKIGSKAAPAEDVPKTSSKYADVVSLSSEQNKQEVYDKISYSLMDVLLKGDKSK